MEAMKNGAISMRLINEYGFVFAVTTRGMDADGMRQVVADFQKEMMRNEINTGMMPSPSPMPKMWTRRLTRPYLKLLE